MEICDFSDFFLFFYLLLARSPAAAGAEHQLRLLSADDAIASKGTAHH